MANQRIRPLAEIGDDEAPYFSMILVRRQTTAARQTRPTLSGVALLALSAGGLTLARRLQPLLPESRVHGLAGRADDADLLFQDTVAHMRGLFVAGTPIVGICAAGILIRALAPLLSDKRREPPVLAVAEDGGTAVPLLGGHQGANSLARAIAEATGGVAAITTAGDVRLGFGLDDPPAGWRVANQEAAKAVTAALLAGEPVRLEIEAGTAGWLTSTGIRVADRGEIAIRVTDRVTDEAETTLVLHPPVLALGVGCERGAEPMELIELARTTLAAHGLAEGAVACVASIDLKADEAAVHAVADALGVPARFFSAAELEAQAPRLANPSDIVFREVGCHGVAEGAALAAAGGDSTLAVEKTRSARGTCAVARSAHFIDAAAVGRPRGVLSIVGIGPGGPDWRTVEAARALGHATDIVGYGLYLELIADLTRGKRLHASPLSEEEARARSALDLAAKGRSVALVSSGDPGIYALASLVFELLDRENRADWNRLAIEVVPGVSALQGAAARAGAVIGHDFCAISLSDLLTPWPEIERRLRAAAEADFVIALYNPVSRRRRAQLPAAREILLAHRPPDTPVVLARNLGRDGEVVRIVELTALTPDDADMLTVVLVGSSRTCLVSRGTHRFVYTPRGYAAKQARTTVDAERAAE
jgi:cobalt-precorrin 5A hydrolase / cobalt-factor III methyltransferase / precorrin-3B C17-methyltransferase